jgi:hypothetical protein
VSSSSAAAAARPKAASESASRRFISFQVGRNGNRHPEGWRFRSSERSRRLRRCGGGRRPLRRRDRRRATPAWTARAP